MEVKPGYKLTEVGVIPDEWEIAPLGNLVDQLRMITYGIVVPGPEARNGVPMIRAQDYSKGWADLDDLYRVSHTIDRAYKRSRVIAGDILLTIVGSVGNLAKVPSTFDRSNITQQTARLSFDSKVANADYYHNLLQSDVGRKVVTNYTKSGVQPSLNLSDVEKFVLPCPPLPEQRAIAEALSDVDALLGALDRLIAKTRDLKQAAMQQLLTGQTRIPGFIGEWQMKTLAQVGRCFAGGTPSTVRPDYWGGEIFWLPSGRVQNNILTSPNDSEINITQRGLDESSAKKIKPDSVLVAITGATCANVALLQFEAAANQSVVAIEPDADTHHQFLFYSLLMERGQILSRQSGSAQGGVNLKTVKGLEVRLPSLAEQSAIAEVLSDMDEELTGLEQRREKTRALKQGMMQELLTGKTRLISPERSHA